MKTIQFILSYFRVYLGIFFFLLLIILSLGMPLISDFNGGCGGSPTDNVQETGGVDAPSGSTEASDSTEEMSETDAKINIKFSIEGDVAEIYNINVKIEDVASGEAIKTIDAIDIADKTANTEIILLRGSSYNFIANVIKTSDNSIVGTGRIDNKTLELAEETVLISINLSGNNLAVDIAFDTKTTSQKDEVTLNGASSSIVIPPATFTDDISVGLSENSVNIDNVKNPISDVLTLSFSDTMLAQNPIHVEIAGTREVEEGGDVFAMVRVEGESTIGHVKSGTWVIADAKFNEESSKYRINIQAAAEKVSIVLVARDNIVIHLIESEEISSDEGAKAFKKGKALKMQAGNNKNWADRGWIVECTFDNPVAKSQLCDRNDSELIKGLKNVLAQLTKKFIDAGMVEAKLDTEERNGKIYNKVTVGDNSLCEGYEDTETLACYSKATGRLILQEVLFKESLDLIIAAIAHELAHAVQAVNVPILFRKWQVDTASWIAEGLADHVGALAIGRNLIAKPFGEERNWESPLASAIDSEPYQTSEFWSMILDFKQNYLLLGELGQTGNSVVFKTYQTISNIFEKAWNRSLGDLYLNAIATHRGTASKYSHCKDYKPANPKTSTIEGKNLKPMSVQCYKVKIDYDSSTGAVPIEVSVPDGDSSPYALVVNGNISRFNAVDGLKTYAHHGENTIMIFNLKLASNSEIHEGKDYKIKIRPICNFYAECNYGKSEGSVCAVHIETPNGDCYENIGNPGCSDLDTIFQELENKALADFRKNEENIKQGCNSYLIGQKMEEEYQKCENLEREKPYHDPKACEELKPGPQSLSNQCESEPSGTAIKNFTNNDVDCPSLDEICLDPVFKVCDE